jgi:hypothetical protein
MQRTGIEEWVKWQVITASVFLINGGVYSLKYPYQTWPAPFQLPMLGPRATFGPTNATGEFFLAPVVAVTGPTFPISGIVAMAAAPVLLLLESDILFCTKYVPNVIKVVLYLAVGVSTSGQLTCVQPALFLIISSSLLIYSATQPRQKILPK